MMGEEEKMRKKGRLVNDGSRRENEEEGKTDYIFMSMV